MQDVVSPADPFGAPDFLERLDEAPPFGDVRIEDLSRGANQAGAFFCGELRHQAAIAAKGFEKIGKLAEPIDEIGRFSPALRGSTGRHAPNRIARCAPGDQPAATARQLKARTIPMSSRAASDM